MDALPLSDGCPRLPKTSRGVLSRLAEPYGRLLRSREQWVGFASQSFFHNPYLAAADMFFVHPGAAHGALSRCFANGWSALGTCGIYSTGRDGVFKKLGLLAPQTFGGCAAAIVADTIFGYFMSLPGFICNYALSGCGIFPSVILGLKAAASACWTSSISGGLFDTFAALDSDDPARKARVPIVVRWLVIDRFELRTRKKLIWLALAVSIIATAAIYCFSPGGLLR